MGSLSGADTWRAVDADGLDPGTGRLPAYPGAPSPAGAVAAVPVATWPLTTASSAGRKLGLADALGLGGARVVDLLDRIVGRVPPSADLPLGELARATPAGSVDLPVAVVPVEEAVRVADEVDGSWMAALDERRTAARSRLDAAERGLELEAALNLAMLVGTEILEGDGHLAARVASGARLWLLGGAVAWALAGGEDPFSSWAELVSFGFWPVGPVEGRVVVGADGTKDGHVA